MLSNISNEYHKAAMKFTAMKFKPQTINFRLVLLVMLVNRHLFAKGFVISTISRKASSSVRMSRRSTAVKKIPASPLKLKSSVSPNEELISSIDQGLSCDLLADAIAFNATAAESLLSELGSMREKGVSREIMDDFLDNLLTGGPDSSFPFWARSKRLARFSRRARMASLRRTLDRTTPPPNDNEDASDEKEQAVQRRRRTMVSVLRSLVAESQEGSTSKVPLIVRIERRAIQAEKDDATNLRNRLPEGLETPEYEIIAYEVSGSRNIEIRKYKPYSVCAVSMNKPRPSSSGKTDAKVQMPEMSGASSFGALAGYLFGKNEESTSMKMTTPVFTSPLPEGDRQMEFVMPSNYWNSLTSAPKPFTESGVTLQERNPGDRAVLMFGGYASKKEVERRKKDLLTALSKDLDWKCIDEEPTVAQYNDPFTPSWKRLNEVSIGVERR